MAMQWRYIAPVVAILIIQLLQSYYAALSANQSTTPWPELGGRRRPTTPLVPKQDLVLQQSLQKQQGGELGLSNHGPPTLVTGTPKRDYANPNLQPTYAHRIIGPKVAANIASYGFLNSSSGSHSPSSPPDEPSSNTQDSASNRRAEDNELREFSEALLRKDANNAFKYVTINYQSKTYSGSMKDEAPEPLLSINSEAFKIPTIEKLLQLYNNYILESSENEVYTAQEMIEENSFIDAILPTSVMQHTRNFLISKGKISKDPEEFKDLLRAIWFNMYPRGQGRIGSSGFEHVFLAEVKRGSISGLHNWLYFNAEEQNKLANYLGFMKKLEFENGAILKFHFTYHQKDKPVGSMFIGTSPEFEFALYSTCFLMRPDQPCPLRLGGHHFVIRTFTYRYRGQAMIGSAFPEI